MGETMKKQSIAWTVIIGATLLALLVLSFGMPQSSTAAPAAAPTPVSVTLPRGPVPEFPVFFNGLGPITEDTRSSCFEVPEYSIVDLQYLIDQTLAGGAVNTTTLKLQFSNDLTTFVDGIAIATSNVTDTSNLQSYAIFGRYTCVYADVSNTNPITLTINGVVK